MVKHHLQLLGMTALTLLAVAPLQAKELADYNIGDTAETDLITPVPLEVIDAEATRTLKERESRRGTIVFCFYPGWADETEAALRANYTQTRSNFLDAIEGMFRQRKLSSRELASTNFVEAVSAFQVRNDLFPVDMTLARLWAGGSDAAYESNLLAQLRTTMTTPVRTDYVPEGIKVGTKVRLLTITNAMVPTVDMAAEYSVDLHKTNLHSIPRSKMWLRQRFPKDQAAVAEQVALFVKPNTFIDVGLTRGLRLQDIEGLWAGDRYEAGQVIVKRGDQVDAKARAALDALAEKTAASQLQQVIAEGEEQTALARRRTGLLIAGFVLGLVLTIFAVWKLARRHPSTLLPARANAAGGSEEAWRQRALSAEQRADQANTVIRQGLVSHLGNWMSNTLVQKLLLQRAQLLDTQKQAASEVNELGERLDTLHTRMQDRLTAYELQIADLEKKLEAKDEVNRELIRSEIASIKRQMEDVRARGEMEFADNDDWRPGVK